MSKRNCSVEGCDSKHDSLGFCGKHYMRWRRHGDTSRVDIIVGDDEARFWEKVDRRGDDECWEWLAATSRGYGHFWAGADESILAHRYAYKLLVGPIPEGMTIDHLCRNTGCVNPAHMEPVTLAENILRGESPSAKAARQTHCIRGHEYTPENTHTVMRPDGRLRHRECRTCKRAYDKKRYAESRGDE